VERCKQQSWKDLQARYRQIRNRLSAVQLRIIRPSKNRRDLGHVPQLFSLPRVPPGARTRLSLGRSFEQAHLCTFAIT
jgi:hypothetical protein